MSSATEYTSFREFCPFCLQEPSSRTSRRLHFTGTTLVIGMTAAVLTGAWWMR